MLFLAVSVVFSCSAVHARDGSRVAYGLLERTTKNVLNTETLSLEGSNVTSGIMTISSRDNSLYAETDLCIFGKAYGLERELVSTLADPAGPDCTAVDGCGAHVLSGTGCTDSTTQGNNFYNADTEDPWGTVGYRTTDADGNSIFFNCVNTGGLEFEGQPFVLNAADGSRVSCGLLMADPMASPTASPTTAPTSSVGKLVPLANALIMLTTAVIAVTL
jgi:hypothetical protein